MAFLLICFHFAAQVFSETLPALPQDVLFDNWQVTWTSASEESTVTYTVRYSSFDSDLWKDVPTCKQINFTSCKVTSIKAEAEHGCVMLGVQAERRGLTSDLVRACSRQGTLCSPEVRLSARPGFFTIYLSRKNGIALEGDHIKHRIYFGKEGEHLEKYEDAVSSVSINNLKEGERYCAKVQYTYFDHPVGLSSCTQCEVIPQSSPGTKQIEKGFAVVLVLILIPFIAYIPLFQRRRIKEWFQPSYKIPDIGHYGWRKKNTAFRDKHLLPTVKYGSGSIMLWSCVACAGLH
ncbi:interferon gamma receptor 2 isoform X3 [Syngnathus typhle]|uniref:interferon gamma receptor 2 isoform X3 n=1 Tax=Syngnathus typhle TaxID=161592 RepID=UPI002A6A117F|nr:interferon gamma receptor 2 isoform X3 [Syngnathus typhle]